LKGHQAGVMDVAVTPDRKRAISVALDGTIKIWNLEGIEETASLSGHQDKVTKIVITPDGKRAISTSRDHTAIVWNLENFQPLLTLKGHTHWVSDIAVMADNRHAVSASWDGTLKFWDLATGELLSTLTVTDVSEHIDVLAVTPDGQYAILVAKGKSLKIWDLNQKVERFILQGHTGDVNAISLTPDGQRVISASDDLTLRVWDLKNGLELLAFPDGFRDSRLSSTAEEFGNESMQAKLVGIMTPPDRTRQNPRYSSLEKSDDAFEQYLFEKGKSKNAVVVMPDGRSVISGSWSGVLQIWDISSGEELLTLDNNASGITAIDVSPNGRFAFVTSGLPYYLSDNTLRVWDLKKRQVVARFIGESPMTACAVAPDGVTVVVGDASGQVHFFRLQGTD
jgi:WD40 repeat protein